MRRIWDDANMAFLWAALMQQIGPWGGRHLRGDCEYRECLEYIAAKVGATGPRAVQLQIDYVTGKGTRLPADQAAEWARNISAALMVGFIRRCEVPPLIVRRDRQ